MNTKYVARFPIFRGASRMRTGQEICVLRQGILSHFKNLLDIFAANGLFKDTSHFEGRDLSHTFNFKNHKGFDMKLSTQS